MFLVLRPSETGQGVEGGHAAGGLGGVGAGRSSSPGASEALSFRGFGNALLTLDECGGLSFSG